MIYKCPTCRKVVAKSLKELLLRAEFFPFCSNRCRLIDLGAWLDAEYKVVSKLPENFEQDNDEPVKNVGNSVESDK